MVQQTVASGEEGQGVIPERWETTAPIYCLERIPKQSTQCESVSCSVVSDSLQPQWSEARQAPLSMEFSRQEYWSGLPFSSPGDLPNPVIEPGSPALQADSLLSEPPGKPLLIVVFDKNMLLIFEHHDLLYGCFLICLILIDRYLDYF